SARRPEPAGAVRVGQPRSAGAARVLTSRAPVAPPGRAGDDPGGRARAAGGAARGDQRAAAELLQPGEVRAGDRPWGLPRGRRGRLTPTRWPRPTRPDPRTATDTSRPPPST